MNKIKWSLKRLLGITLVGIYSSFLIGCSNSLWLKPNEKVLTHLIEHQGETLSSIARWYTGNGDNWPKLLSYNPSVSKNVLQIGDVILIPESMLVRTTTPPREALIVSGNNDLLDQSIRNSNECNPEHTNGVNGGDNCTTPTPSNPSSKPSVRGQDDYFKELKVP